MSMIQLSRLLGIWGFTIFLSLLFLSIAILIVYTYKTKAERVYSKFGIKDYFSRKGGLSIYFLLLVPILNIICVLYVLLLIATDLGDD